MPYSHTHSLAGASKQSN